MDYVLRVEHVADDLRHSLNSQIADEDSLDAPGTRALSKWESRCLEWKNVSASLARRTGRSTPEDLCMTTGDSRERAELQQLLQCAPGRKVVSEHTWENTLRGASTSAVPVGNIFSGLYCNITDTTSKPRVIRRPVPSRHTEGAPGRHRRSWKDSPALRVATKKAHDLLHTAYSHELGQRAVEDLMVTGRDLLQWAADSNRDYVQQCRREADEEVDAAAAAAERAPSYSLSEEPSAVARLSESSDAAPRATCHVFLEAIVSHAACLEVRIVNSGHAVLRANWRRLEAAAGGSAFSCPDDEVVVLPNDSVCSSITFCSSRGGLFEGEMLLEAHGPACVISAGWSGGEAAVLVFNAGRASSGGNGGGGAVVALHMRGVAVGASDARGPLRERVEERLRAQVAADRREEAAAAPEVAPDEEEIRTMQQDAFEWRNRAMCLQYSPQIYDEFARLANKVRKLQAAQCEGEGVADLSHSQGGQPYDDVEKTVSEDAAAALSAAGSEEPAEGAMVEPLEAEEEEEEEMAWDGDVAALQLAIAHLLADVAPGAAADEAGGAAQDEILLAAAPQPGSLRLFGASLSSSQDGDSRENDSEGDADEDRSLGSSILEGSEEGAAAAEADDAAEVPATENDKHIEELRERRADSLLREWRCLVNQALLVPLPAAQSRMAVELNDFAAEAAKLLGSRPPPPPPPPPPAAAAATAVAAAQPTTSAPPKGAAAPRPTVSAALTTAAAAPTAAAASAAATQQPALPSSPTLEETKAAEAAEIAALLRGALERFESLQRAEDEARRAADIQRRYPFQPLSAIALLQPQDVQGQRVLLHVPADASDATNSAARSSYFPAEAALASIRACLAGRPAAVGLLPHLMPEAGENVFAVVAGAEKRSLRRWASSLAAALAMEVDFFESVPAFAAALEQADRDAPGSRVLALERLDWPGVIPVHTPQDAEAAEPDEEEPIPDLSSAAGHLEGDAAPEAEAAALAAAAAPAGRGAAAEVQEWAESAALLAHATDVMVLDAPQAVCGRSETLALETAHLCSLCVAGPRLASDLSLMAHLFEPPAPTSVPTAPAAAAGASSGGSGSGSGSSRTGLFAVIGGSCLVPRLAMLDGLLDVAAQVAVVGGAANTLLAALGRRVPPAQGDEEALVAARRLCAKASRRGTRLLLPVDLVVGDMAPDAAGDLTGAGEALQRGNGSNVSNASAASYADDGNGAAGGAGAGAEYPGETADVTVSDGVPLGWFALDVGPRTVARIAEGSREAAVVLWAGLPGATEYQVFQEGARALAATLGRQEAAPAAEAAAGEAAGEQGRAAAQAGARAGSGESASDESSRASGSSEDEDEEEEEEEQGAERDGGGGSSSSGPVVPVVVCGGRTLLWAQKALQEAAEDGDDDSAVREWMACGCPDFCRAVLSGGRLGVLQVLLDPARMSPEAIEGGAENGLHDFDERVPEEGDTSSREG